MRVIKRSIRIDNCISRFSGLVPGAIPIWKTPVGDFLSLKEAQLAIIDSRNSTASIKEDVTYRNINLLENKQGNYSLIPFNITLSSITGSESSETVPYSEVMSWYRFLYDYNEKKGDYGTAEEKYILETNRENILPQHLSETREEDEWAELIYQFFNQGRSEDEKVDPFQWLKDNVTGQGSNTETPKGIISESDDVLSRGYFNVPLLITTNIDEMGQMSVFGDDYDIEDWRVTLQPGDFKIGEVYEHPQVKVEITEGSQTYEDLIHLDAAYIVTSFTRDNGSVVKSIDSTSSVNGSHRVSSSDEPSYEHTYIVLGKVKVGDEILNVNAEEYYNWLYRTNNTYDTYGDIPYSSKTFTTWDFEGNLVVNDASATTKDYEMSVVSDYGFFLINGEEYDVRYDYFIKFNKTGSAYNGMEFPLFETNKHNLEPEKYQHSVYYTVVNGKIYVADMEKTDESGDDSASGETPVFYFDDPSSCYRKNGQKTVPDSITEKKYYIEYGGMFIEINGNEITLTDVDTEIGTESLKTYKRLMYSVSVEGNTYYIPYKEEGDYQTEKPCSINYEVNPNHVTLDTYDFGGNVTQVLTPEFADSETIINGNVLTVEYKTVSGSTKIITGNTVSRLHTLRDLETSADLMGNELPGVFDYEYDSDAESARTADSGRVNTKYFEPYDGMLLEIPYHICNTNNLETVDDKLIGDIISKVVITPYDVEGNAINVDYYEDDIHILIHTVTYDATNIGIEDVFDRTISTSVIEPMLTYEHTDKVIISFTYQISAELERFGENQKWYAYKPKSTGGLITAGIVYKEEFEIQESICQFKTDEDKSYTLRFYDFTPLNNRAYVNSDYEKEVYESQSTFEMAVNTITWANEAERKGVTGYDKNNGMTLSPLIRKDYMMGISSPQSNLSDIYIDRGISTVYEKRMKLTETRTLEALTHYGNNWFKIEEY